MLTQFKGFIGYSEDEFEELWEKAIFVIDTNILINFYKYKSKQSTKSLLGILKKLKINGRLWIPHQVALEYFFNYEDNMNKQNEGYDLLQKDLLTLKDNAVTTLRKLKSEHPYIMTDKFDFFIENMSKSNEKLQEMIKVEVDNLPDSHAIQQDLLSLLEEIVGEPYSQKRIDEIEKDGEERYKYNVPPGFKDSNDKIKKNIRTYGDFRYQQIYGDLIVWHQIMDKAKKNDKPMPIILITEDRKDDWWEKDGSKIKRPHPQLLQEFLNKTQQKFYMYRTDSFIKHAIKYLDAEVSETQVQEVTTEIENIRKLEDLEENIKSVEELNVSKENRNIISGSIEGSVKRGIVRVSNLSSKESSYLFDTSVMDIKDLLFRTQQLKDEILRKINQLRFSIQSDVFDRKLNDLTHSLVISESEVNEIKYKFFNEREIDGIDYFRTRLNYLWMNLNDIDNKLNEYIAIGD